MNRYTEKLFGLFLDPLVSTKVKSGAQNSKIGSQKHLVLSVYDDMRFVYGIRKNHSRKIFMNDLNIVKRDRNI